MIEAKVTPTTAYLEMLVTRLNAAGLSARGKLAFGDPATDTG
jgi:hypothetical protein